MFITLITGRMGSGKTEVLSLLEREAWPVFQADQVAKSFWLSQSPCFLQLKAILGDACFQDDNHLDFSQLANILFSNSSLLKQVEEVIHPLVQQEFQKFLEEQKTLGKNFIFYEAPPIIKINKKKFSFVVVVHAEEKLIIERLKQKKLSKADIQSRLKYQTAEQELLQIADFVIYNDGDLESLEQQTDQCLARIMNN